MRNECSRSRGVAQRAFALFMALVLATTLTIPSYSYAEEVNAANSTAAAEATGASQGAGNTAAAAPSGSTDTVSVSGDQQKQAVSSSESTGAASDTATATGTGSGKGSENNASTGQAGNSGITNSSPAAQNSATQAETVSATLKISVYGTTLVAHTFDIEKGKTVEDLLNLAKAQGYIDAYEHGDPYKGLYYTSSITVKGKAYTQPADYSEYWSSTIKGEWESTGLNGTVISENGFSYELNYVSYSKPDQKYDNGTGDYPTTPDAQHPDKASGNDTTSYVKNTGNSSTVTSAPTSSNNAALVWKKNYGAFSCLSNVLTIGDAAFIAAGSYGSCATLYRLNAKTGEEIASLQLFSAIDYTCRPVYTDGVIVIPLSNGRLQAVSATEMKTLWVSSAAPLGTQTISTVTAVGGMVFTGTASVDNSGNCLSGSFFGINAITGQRVWTNEETTTGYYWSGACRIGKVLVYGNDAGVLSAVDPATGKTISALKLSSPIRSSVISNASETEAYVTTKDGKLHKVAVSADGSLAEAGTAAFSAYSTSTATLFEGNLFIGGSDSRYKGLLSVIDAATMQVKSTIELPYEVKSTPLVAKAADGKTYAYFTCNGAEGDWPNYTNGGGAWVYCLETNTATRLFDATGDMANYCTKSITMGADGTLYWTNDSGTLFALASKAFSNNNNEGKKDGSEKEQPTTPQNNAPKTKGNNGGNNGTSGSTPAAHTPLSTAELEQNGDDNTASAETEQTDEGNNIETAGAASARNASTDNSNDQQQIPWAPIAGIAIGCAGLAGVGIYLFRRRAN